MPSKNCNENQTRVDQLEISSRILQTVKKQIESYSLSLEKIILLRREVEMDPSILKQIQEKPESLPKLFIDRGIPPALAYGMAAEDLGRADLFGDQMKLALWTWDCCCTGCCFTCWNTSTR